MRAKDLDHSILAVCCDIEEFCVLANTVRGLSLSLSPLSLSLSSSSTYLQILNLPVRQRARDKEILLVLHVDLDFLMMTSERKIFLFGFCASPPDERDSGFSLSAHSKRRAHPIELALLSHCMIHD